jgi:hypothetical protein
MREHAEPENSAPMEKAIKWYLLMNCAGCLAFSQPPEPPPKFEIADVHVSAKTANPFMRTGPVKGGRYEVKDANMVDFVNSGTGDRRNDSRRRDLPDSIQIRYKKISIFIESQPLWAKELGVDSQTTVAAVVLTRVTRDPRNCAVQILLEYAVETGKVEIPGSMEGDA